MNMIFRRVPGGLGVLIGMLLLLIAFGACSSGDDAAVDLLEDPKVGLEHLNAELHAIKGEELLASPEIGLAHLNDELHLLKDSKVGLAHLNDELHGIKQTLADLSQQLQALQR